jgi:hypothetical protein
MAGLISLGGDPSKKLHGAFNRAVTPNRGPLLESCSRRNRGWGCGRNAGILLVARYRLRVFWRLRRRPPRAADGEAALIVGQAPEKLGIFRRGGHLPARADQSLPRFHILAVNRGGRPLDYGRDGHRQRRRYCSRVCDHRHRRDHRVPVYRVRDRMVHPKAARAPRTARRRVIYRAARIVIADATKAMDVRDVAARSLARRHHLQLMRCGFIPMRCKMDATASTYFLRGMALSWL